jgi:hypothetical protein
LNARVPPDKPATVKALLLVLLCVSPLAMAQYPFAKQVGLEIPAAGRHFEQLETKESYIFTGVDVLEKLPDGIYIRLKDVTTPATKSKKGKVVERGTFLLAGGTTFLPYESLPVAAQKKLGGFKAGDASAARAQRAKDRAEKKPVRFVAAGDADEKFVPYAPKEEFAKLR